MTQAAVFHSRHRQPAPAGVVLLSARELDKMRQVGQLAAALLDYLETLVQPGVSTQALNAAAASWTAARGAVSAPLGYAPPGQPPFPGSICTSVNEVVCHGIPSPHQILQSGDLINIDVTPKLAGYHGDTSRTFVVGTATPEASRLVAVTHQAMMLGIAAVRPGARVGDIGAAIQSYAEAQGFSVVRELVGHGVGRLFHGEPQIPHYGRPGTGPKLRPGMVFTVEPMLNQGGPAVELLRDRWTIVTRDRKPSAQFEHTVAVTATGVEILTQSAPQSAPQRTS
jgi:methionyl aminopeptidase